MKFTSILKLGVLFCVQVGVLVVVQIFGFVLGAQLAGVLPAPSHATTPPVAARASLTDSAEETPQRSDTTRSKSEKQAQQARMFGILALVCLLNSAAMTLWLRQTSLSGLRLIGGTFLVVIFCMTIMPQIETFVFLRNSAKIIRMAGAMGLCVSGLFAISTVPVLGRWKKVSHTLGLKRFRELSRWGVIIRLAICIAVYVAIYLTFGYFVAWQNPELRRLYGGSSEHVVGFWQLISTSPVVDRVIPLQVFRGFAWTLICLAMISVSTSRRWALAISIGLVLAIVMNSQLLLPNPIMSAGIRYAHMLETATSNFLFGAFCVMLWTPSPRHPERDSPSAVTR